MVVANEEELRSFSKQFGTIIPRKGPILEDDVRRLEDTLLWLLNAAEFPQLGLTHRAAACNALCGFVDTTTESNIAAVRLVTLNQAVWNRLLSFYFDHYQDASTRSMKQFLSTLINLVRANQRDTSDGTSKWAEDVGSMCIRSISSYSDLNSLKPSMLLLEDLLSRNLLPRSKFIELLGVVQQEKSPVPIVADSASIQNQSPEDLVLYQIVCDVLRWCKHTDIASVAGRLLKAIFTNDKHGSISVPKTESFADVDKPIWLSPILSMAKDDFAGVERLERHILPQLLAIDERSLIYLIRQLPFYQLLSGDNGGVQEADIKFLILLVTVIRSMKLSASLTNQIQLHTQVPFTELREKLAICCLQHQSSHVRIGAMKLIVIVDGTTQPFSESSLNQLRLVLKTLFVESDAKVRGDVISILKRLTERLCLSMKKLKKISEAGLQAIDGSETDHMTKQKSLEWHTAFVSWFHDFLCEGLRPSASYQRHITALKVLNMASTLALFSTCKIDLFSHTIITQLTDLILDPFEDVRSTSAMLLTCAEPLDDDLFDPMHEASFVSIAKARMITTGRASISDGYARLMELSYHRAQQQPKQNLSQCHAAQILLKDITQGLAIAQSNFHEAVKHPQLHGQFSALRYIVVNTRLLQVFRGEEEWMIFKNELISCCHQAWQIVKPILCIDSPEGHADEEDMQDTDIGIKDTLSYSWRTLRESSALLQTLVEHSKTHLLSLEESQKIGDLCFTQLAELRHRGAFSTVAQCFTSSCVRDGRQLDKESRPLVEGWYKRLLHLIDAQSAALTRRSAGLPAMITSILSADVEETFLDMVFKDLQSIASRDASIKHQHGKTGLPQVHAMNCLGAIFSSSRLGHIAERYLEGVLRIAVQSLDHDIWSVRNCGGMLLNAILNRLNGGVGVADQQGGHRSGAKTACRRYPSLSTTLESLLRTSVSYVDTSFVDQANRQVNNGFPALAIIDQVGVQEDRADIVRGLLFELLDSPVWLIRERAADSISQLIDSTTILETIHAILKSNPPNDTLRTNRLHGSLLCLKASLERCLPRDSCSFLLQLLDYFETFNSWSCPFVSAIYFDILAMLFQSFSLSNSISDRDMTEKNAQERIEEFTIVLEKYMTRGETVHPSSHRLYVLLRMRKHKLKTDEQEFSSCIDINKDTAVFVAQFLIIQRNEVLYDWDHWLPGLFDACTGLIREDSESSLALETIEQLTELLTKSQVVAYMNSERTKTSHTNTKMARTRSIERLLSECEKLMRKGRDISRIVLKLYGALAAAAGERGSEFETQCSRWIREIQFAMNDEMDVSRRSSAIKALSNARQLVREYLRPLDNKYSQEASILVSILFDGLVDDDDDVRNMTANAVSYVTTTSIDETRSPPSLNSMIAQDILVQHVKTHGTCSTALFSEFLGRLLDLQVLSRSSTMPEDTSVLINKGRIVGRQELTPSLSQGEEVDPIAQAIQRALAEDNTLFEQERQNLYKDNVQQMQLWAKILISMPCRAVAIFTHSKARPAELSTFCQWAISGLEMIAQTSGSLGWAHRQNGFEVICRALIFAKVVLSWHPILHSLVRLRNALAAVEAHLQPIHGEHRKIIDHLKLQLEQIS